MESRSPATNTLLNTNQVTAEQAPPKSCSRNEDKDQSQNDNIVLDIAYNLTQPTQNITHSMVNTVLINRSILQSMQVDLQVDTADSRIRDIIVQTRPDLIQYVHSKTTFYIAAAVIVLACILSESSYICVCVCVVWVDDDHILYLLHVQT